MGKGEIARYEQFLLSPQCFQKSCAADTYETGLVWERVKSYLVTALVIDEGCDRILNLNSLPNPMLLALTLIVLTR